MDMNSNISYRELHESFMQNHNGTSIWENISIIAPAPLIVYFIGLVKFHILYNHLQWVQVKTSKVVVIFFLEFILTIGFLTLHFTLLSNYVHLTALLLLTLFVYSVLHKWFKKAGEEREKFMFSTEEQTSTKHKPYFTYFRSIISVMSCICILAVDFRVFPRRFAKTESYGYALMDTGVGFYIVANGIVIKQEIGKKKVLLKVLLSCVPIMVLGAIRCYSVDALDYQKHVSEYGVHWNFFFTLAFVKILASLMINIYPNNVALMAMSTAIVHQIILSCSSEQWVMEESTRDNLLTANKEGIASILGYISLYLFSVALGTILNERTVTFTDDIRRGISTIKWSAKLLIITLIFQWFFGISRRLANITYITWMLSMSSLGVGLSMLAEFALRLSLSIGDNAEELMVPCILEAVNYNSLPYFLLSNLLTGAINLTFHTLYADSVMSILLLLLYQFIVCCIMYYLFLYRIKLKFW